MENTSSPIIDDAIQAPAQLKKRATRLPEGWQPDEADILKLKREFPGFDLTAELEGFRDYWTAKAGAAATKMDWRATYRIWMRKAAKTPLAKGAAPYRPSAPPTHTQKTEPDHLLYFANRLLWRHLSARHGLGSSELTAALKVKRDIIEWFTQPVREGDESATPKEFVTQFAQALGKVSPLTQQTREYWWRYIKSDAAQKPFPIEMARRL
jgi:hypothetical protein